MDFKILLIDATFYFQHTQKLLFNVLIKQKIETNIKSGPAVEGQNQQWVNPSKHEALTQCCFNVGPPLSTPAQH